MRKNISEFVEDGREVIAIQDNESYEQISTALLKILSSYDEFSKAARECFLKNFYYRNHKEIVNRIVNKKDAKNICQ